MEENHIKQFAKIDDESFGKRAFILSKTRDLCNVPNGFVLSQEIMDDFLEKNQIKDTIKRYLSNLMIDNENIIPIVNAVQKLIINAKFPAELEEEILEYYEYLSSNSGSGATSLLQNGPVPVVAVRNGEFGHNIYQLNVHGKNKLLENIKIIFASNYTSQKVIERKNNNEELFVANPVIIQEMIMCQRSGISKTEDDGIVINAYFGLGIAKDDDKLECDKYYLDKDIVLKNSVIGNQSYAYEKDIDSYNTVKYDLKENGTKEKLSTPLIKEIFLITKKISRILQGNVKVEWGISKKELFIFDIHLDTLEKEQNEPVNLTELKEQEQNDQNAFVDNNLSFEDSKAENIPNLEVVDIDEPLNFEEEIRIEEPVEVKEEDKDSQNVTQSIESEEILIDTHELKTDVPVTIPDHIVPESITEETSIKLDHNQNSTEEDATVNVENDLIITEPNENNPQVGEEKTEEKVAQEADESEKQGDDSEVFKNIRDDSNLLTLTDLNEKIEEEEKEQEETASFGYNFQQEEVAKGSEETNEVSISFEEDTKEENISVNQDEKEELQNDTLLDKEDAIINRDDTAKPTEEIDEIEEVEKVPDNFFDNIKLEDDSESDKDDPIAFLESEESNKEESSDASGMEAGTTNDEKSNDFEQIKAKLDSFEILTNEPVAQSSDIENSEDSAKQNSSDNQSSFDAFINNVEKEDNPFFNLESNGDDDNIFKTESSEEESQKDEKPSIQEVNISETILQKQELELNEPPKATEKKEEVDFFSRIEVEDDGDFIFAENTEDNQIEAKDEEKKFEPLTDLGEDVFHNSNGNDSTKTQSETEKNQFKEEKLDSNQILQYDNQILKKLKELYKEIVEKEPHNLYNELINEISARVEFSNEDDLKYVRALRDKYLASYEPLSLEELTKCRDICEKFCS
ncbi:hypothetical protein BVX95_01370 [archaeon D22]|nr:hypothetical protein BVX95_01370 [archaeon D22]